MKSYYAKYKGKCYAFNDKGGRNTAVEEYRFELMTACQALRQFGYTDSRSLRVIKCTVVPCATPLEMRNFLSEVTR